MEVYLELATDLKAALIQGRDGIKMAEQKVLGQQLAMGINLYPP